MNIVSALANPFNNLMGPAFDYDMRWVPNESRYECGAWATSDEAHCGAETDSVDISLVVAETNLSVSLTNATLKVHGSLGPCAGRTVSYDCVVSTCSECVKYHMSTRNVGLSEYSMVSVSCNGLVTSECN